MHKTPLKASKIEDKRRTHKYFGSKFLSRPPQPPLPSPTPSSVHQGQKFPGTGSNHNNFCKLNQAVIMPWDVSFSFPLPINLTGNKVLLTTTLFLIHLLSGMGFPASKTQGKVSCWPSMTLAVAGLAPIRGVTWTKRKNKKKLLGIITHSCKILN